MKTKKVYHTPVITVQKVRLESGFLASSPIKADVEVKPFVENSQSLDDFTIEF